MRKRMGDEEFARRANDGCGWDNWPDWLYTEACRAREAERKLRDALECASAAIGDRLLAKGALSREYAGVVLTTIREALE